LPSQTKSYTRHTHIIPNTLKYKLNKLFLEAPAKLLGLN
jgi:hypothetical protein